MFKSYWLLLFFSLMLMMMTSGCENSGPSLPVEAIEKISQPELKTCISDLYNNDPEDVYYSMKKIASYGQGAEQAVPFLATMLTDRRIAKIKTYNIVRYMPLFKEAAVTLALTDENGVKALVGLLANASALEGTDDDFYREGLSVGLNTAVEKYGSDVFRKMNLTDNALYVIDAVTACMKLKNNPGRWDKSDPRKNLKLYKHFNDVRTREGLLVYIQILGMIGDERALDVLQSITPILIKPGRAFQINGYNRFHRAAAVSQYKIRPVPVSELNPDAAKIIFIDLVSTGQKQYVSKMLDDGLNLDIKTLNGEPALSYVFRNDRDMFNQLVNKGADINCRLSKNDTMLIRAARKGDYDFAMALIENGACVELVNNAKETAIMASFTIFINEWNGKKKDKKVEDYFKLLHLLKASGSPPVPVKLLKSLDNKKQKIIFDRTGITG